MSGISCARCEGEIADLSATVRGRFGLMHEDGGVCVLYERQRQYKTICELRCLLLEALPFVGSKPSGVELATRITKACER